MIIFKHAIVSYCNLLFSTVDVDVTAGIVASGVVSVVAFVVARVGSGVAVLVKSSAT